MRKKIFCLLLLLCWFSLPVFSQGICLTEAEFHELMAIIKTSRMNSEQQRRLIAELRETLTAQEAELKQVLGSLEQSGAGLAELKASLSRMRIYSDGLNEYCKTLESENSRLGSRNSGLKIGIGLSGGAAGVLAIVLLILIL